MPKPTTFAFVCINQRDPSHPRPSCNARGGGDVFNALREEQGRRAAAASDVVGQFSAAAGARESAELPPAAHVKVVASGCLEACMVGPVVAVFPDNVIYGGVIEDDVPAIMDHLLGGQVVAPLEIGDAEFDLRPPEMGR